MTILTEGLDHKDMEGQVEPHMTVDEYSAKMGKDKDIVTITFIVNSQLAANDLVTWFERGYDFVLDASVSDGEIEPGKWLVFVEMDRRSKVPNRIITLLEDLETLTELKLKDWTVEIEGDDCKADEEQIRSKMILNPNQYEKQEEETEETEDELNEMRLRAGLEPKTFYVEDEYIKNLKAIAGM
jgi:hypothetical protein